MSEAYTAYLKTQAWKRLRKRILKRDGWRCRSCGGPATQVHHEDYQPETMRGERPERLYSLCGACHEAVSLDMFGLKRAQREVTDLTRLLATPEAPRPPWSRRHRRDRPRRRHKLTIGEIRQLSQRYAEGRMK